VYELKSPLNIWTPEGLTVAEPPNVILQDETGAVIAVDPAEAEAKQAEIQQAIIARDEAIQEETPIETITTE
jgi:hypothetical protein